MLTLLTKTFKSSLVRAFALLAVTVGTAQAGDSPFAQYDCSGVRGNRGMTVAGTVRFGADSNRFRANFNPSTGAAYNFGGTYEELDLLFITFWTFDGSRSARGGIGSASGAGIRLLFGLLTFGTLEDSQGVLLSFSGLFDGIVDASPGDDDPAFVGRETRIADHHATDRRRGSIATGA